MKQASSYIILILIILSVTSCKDRRTTVTNITSKNDTLKLDSVITLSKYNSAYKGSQLTYQLARHTVNTYFKSKGFLISDSLPENLSEKDYANLAVRFDTLFQISVNNNEFSDALVTYWLTPPGASGTCWQPHKAIIADTDRGYELLNEDFIPNDFTIESTKEESAHSVAYGYQYDCANHKNLRQFTIIIR